MSFTYRTPLPATWCSGLQRLQRRKPAFQPNLISEGGALVLARAQDAAAGDADLGAQLALLSFWKEPCLNTSRMPYLSEGGALVVAHVEDDAAGYAVLRAQLALGAVGAVGAVVGQRQVHLRNKKHIVLMSSDSRKCWQSMRREPCKLSEQTWILLLLLACVV